MEYVIMAYIHGTLKLNGDRENINVLEGRLDSVSLVFWSRSGKQCSVFINGKKKNRGVGGYII